MFNSLQPGVIMGKKNLRKKPKGFLMFSVGIDNQHRVVMGEV